MKPNGGPKVRPRRASYSTLDLLVDFRLIAANLLLKDGGQRGSSVFGIHVDAPGQQSLLADVSSCEVETALDFQVGMRFDLLREKFAQDQRFGKVLGTDHDAIGMRSRTR